MAELPILGYKRHSPPVLKDKVGARDAVLLARKSGSVNPEEKYLTDELQRIENSLDTNSQQTRTVNNGVIEVKQTVIDLSETVETNASTSSAAITQEATLRVSADEALAQLTTNLTATVSTNASTGAAALASELIVRATADSALSSSLTTLSATVTSGDSSNAAAITSEQTARVNADESLTLISNTQRALFGAAVSDNWDSTVEYTGSTVVVGNNTVGTGDDVVYGGFIYRCKDTHTNKVPPNTLYWDRVDTVDAKVTAAVLIESTARSTADSAQAAISAALSGRVSTLEGDTTDAVAIAVNAGDIITTNNLIVTKDAANAERFQLTAARFGITVADTYDNARTYQIGEEAIYSTILYRCKAITAGNLPTDTVYWTFQELVPAAISAAVQTETTARATADTAQASVSNSISGRVTVLENDNTDALAIAVNAGDIVDIEEVIVTNEAASAERFQLTAARLGITVPDTYDSAREYQVGEEAIYSAILYRCTAITEGNIPTNTLYWSFQELVPAAIAAAVLTETNARATADEASAEKLELTAARLGITVDDTYDSARTYQVGEEAVYSAALYRCTTITTGNLPTNTSYWGLQELVPEALTAAVLVESNARVAADGVLLAKYGVALNANGYITGFSQNNDGTTGSFKIIADDFRIIDPSSTAGAAGDQVFSVINGVVTMGTAHIGNLSIGTGKLEDNAATVLSTTELASAVTLSTTSLVLLSTLSFTGSVAAAEVHATFTASGNGSNTIRLHYYHNDVFKVARYKQYDGTTITLPITTTSGANTIKVYGQLYSTALGSASIDEGYVRCLETKK